MRSLFSVLFSVLFLVFSLNALAVPRGLYIAAPHKIKVVGNKVQLTLKLACKNEYPDEWAGNLVAVSDDEGDMAIALGVVLSQDSCDAGPKKNFVFEYDLKQTGVTASDLANGVTLEPVDVAH